LLMNSTTLH